VDALVVTDHTLHRHDVDDRYVLLRGWPGGGQPTSRLRGTSEDVDQRPTVLLPAEPGQEHRRDVLAPRHEHGRPRVDDDDRVRVRCGDRPHELILAARQG